MGLQSAMTTALTGLQAAETSIDVIGNNIANSNTVGFKESDVIFATQFLATQSIGSAPSAATGGTNPRQIGLGVKVSQIAPNFSQGTIEISSNPLDLAIQGDGFLMVQGSQGEPLFTRNGQLNLNSANEVVTASGNRLLGYGVDDRYELQTAQVQPIEIPLGSQRVAQATSEAVFQGVLNPSVQPGTVPGEVQSEVLTDLNVERIDDAAFTTEDIQIVAAPSPASTATSTPGVPTTVSGGTYSYRFTFRDSTRGLESSPSSATPTLTVTGGDQIDLTSLPNDATGAWDQVVVYRTDGTGAGDFREIGTQAMGTPTFTDAVDDAAWATGGLLDSDAVDSGTYSYRLTYFNPSTGDETRPTDVFGNYPLTNDDSSIRLDLSDIDSPDNDQFTELRIYRTISGSTSDYRLVDTIAAPTSPADTIAYVDKTSSATMLANPATHPQLDVNGTGTARAGFGTLLLDIGTLEGNGHQNLFQEGTLSFTGEVAGSSLTTQDFTITSSSTMQDLVDFMTESLGLQDQSNVQGIDLPLNGGQIDIDQGALIVTSNFGEENAVNIPLTAFRLTPTGSAVSQAVGINFSETQAANGPGTTSEFVVYDSLGSPLTVRLTTVLEDATSDSTTYRWYAASGDSQPSQGLSTVVGNGVMVFDSRGDLVSSPAASISVFREQTAGESPLEIDLDFSAVTSLAENDASGNPVSSFNMTRQDGFPPGVLTDFIITESGEIQGQFSNGTQRTLGQVVMARFANPQGLRQVGDSLYSTSVNSGEALTGNPGADGLGSITAGAVELSNTDIGQDLIEMILAQTQYQAGSRVISAAQELLDELLALQR